MYAKDSMAAQITTNQQQKNKENEQLRMQIKQMDLYIKQKIEESKVESNNLNQIIAEK